MQTRPAPCSGIIKGGNPIIAVVSFLNLLLQRILLVNLYQVLEIDQ